MAIELVSHSYRHSTVPYFTTKGSHISASVVAGIYHKHNLQRRYVMMMVGHKIRQPWRRSLTSWHLKVAKCIQRDIPPIQQGEPRSENRQTQECSTGSGTGTAHRTRVVEGRWRQDKGKCRQVTVSARGIGLVHCRVNLRFNYRGGGLELMSDTR